MPHTWEVFFCVGDIADQLPPQSLSETPAIQNDLSQFSIYRLVEKIKFLSVLGIPHAEASGFLNCVPEWSRMHSISCFELFKTDKELQNLYLNPVWPCKAVVAVPLGKITFLLICWWKRWEGRWAILGMYRHLDRSRLSEVSRHWLHHCLQKDSQHVYEVKFSKSCNCLWDKEAQTSFQCFSQLCAIPNN